MLKRPHYIALGLIVVLTLTILNLPSRTTARLKQGVGGFFFPLFRLANASQQVAGQAVDSVLPRSELLRQNQALRKENDELKLQLTRTEELTRENEQLRKL